MKIEFPIQCHGAIFRTVTERRLQPCMVMQKASFRRETAKDGNARSALKQGIRVRVRGRERIPL